MAKNGTDHRVLVADDDDLVRRFLSTFLTSEGYSVRDVPDGQAALDAAREGGFSLLLLDLVMPGLTGLEVVAELRAARDVTPAILISGSLTDEVKKACSRYASVECVDKPVTLDALKGAISRALGSR